jgi:hypothetical protein
LADVLPQQRLVLELLSMSGDIAVPVTDETTVLWRTLHECRLGGWVRIYEISTGIDKIQLALTGRRALRDTAA